jgi:Uma2 family endonuclease
MNIATPLKLTLADFLQLPETKPASELIDGEVIQKPMPQGIHSLIQVKLSESINRVTQPQKVALALTEIRCTFGDNVIVPDLAVFRWSRIPKTPSGRIANQFEIHPDWIVEILSPGQRLKKVLAKLLHCSRHGTELGWLINPEEELVLVVFPGQKVDIYEDNDQLPILAGIEMELTVNQIFDWLRLD